MKKIVFAFQVFGLMAMLPLMVALEMNHKKERLQLNNPIAAVNGVAQNALALVPVDLPSQFLPIALSTMFTAAKPTKQYKSGQCILTNCTDGNTEVSNSVLYWKFPIFSKLD